MTGPLRSLVVDETGEPSSRDPGRYAPVGLGASTRSNADPWSAEVCQEGSALRPQGRRGKRRSSRQEAVPGRQDQRFQGRRPFQESQGGEGWAREGEEKQQ